MLYTGLVSITFRQLSPREIIALVAQAGLAGIEWGGDIHVPHGNVAVAREVHQMTADAGLKVAAYGSYYRAGCSGEGLPNFDAVLDTAVALGAPLIRLWSGNQPSAKADTKWRAHVVKDTQRAADMAASEGLDISFEYHGGTLTDRPESALDFLTAVDRPNVKAYWQPDVGVTAADRVAALDAVLPWVSNIHVFQWELVDAAVVRFPLAKGADEWHTYLSMLAATGRDHYSLIEFVEDNRPEQFLDDARALKSMIARAASANGSV